MQLQSQPTIPINNIRHKALMSNLYKQRVLVYQTLTTSPVVLQT